MGGDVLASILKKSHVSCDLNDEKELVKKRGGVLQRKRHVLRPWEWEVLDAFKNSAKCKESSEK